MTYAFDVFRQESRPALIMASSADDAPYRGRWLAAVPVAVAILMLVLSAVANAPSAAARSTTSICQTKAD